jgi:hypothetical protein
MLRRVGFHAAFSAHSFIDPYDDMDLCFAERELSPPFHPHSPMGIPLE